MIVLGADTDKRSQTVAAVGGRNRRAARRADRRRSAGAGSVLCCGGREALTATACGRWRTAGTSPGRSSGF